MKRIATFALFMALAMGHGFAQDYPVRPIRILSPYSPGGISDIAARIVAGKLTEAWGQQVIVENRPGGNGFIAVTDVARAAPDGYTLVMVTAGDVTINPSLFKNVPYDIDRDLAPVSAVSDAPLVSRSTARRHTRPSPMSSPPRKRSPVCSIWARLDTAVLII